MLGGIFIIITRYFNGKKLSSDEMKNVVINTPELRAAIRSARGRADVRSNVNSRSSANSMHGVVSMQGASSISGTSAIKSESSIQNITSSNGISSTHNAASTPMIDAQMQGFAAGGSEHDCRIAEPNGGDPVEG